MRNSFRPHPLRCTFPSPASSGGAHEAASRHRKQIAAHILATPLRDCAPGPGHHPCAKIFPGRHQDLRDKQLEPILKFYSPDAAFLNGERTSGPAALRTLFQNVMATFNSDLTLHSQNTETSGELAYDSGDFQETLTTIATGARTNYKGNYLIIFKRQPAGPWLIVQHVWTLAQPTTK